LVLLLQSAAKYREEGRVADALATLSEAVERFPNEAAPLHDLARLAEKRRDWKQAERYWRAFLTINDRPAWAHSSLATAVFEQGHPEAAETILGAAAAQRPDDPALASDLARLAGRRRDWDAAAMRWKSVQQRFGPSLESILGEALALRELDQMIAAEKLLQAATLRFPEAAAPWHDLARIAERRRDWIQAELCWRRFLEIDDRPEWAHAGLANALNEQGRPEAAEAALGELIRCAPHNSGFAMEYARLAERRKDWAAALVRWQEFQTLFPDRVEGLIGEARVRREVGEIETAENRLEAATALLPQAPAPWHDLARIAERRRDWVRAEECWRNFLKLDDRPSWAHTALAAALNEQGRHEAADMSLAEAMARWPDDPAFALEHARLAERRGDWSSALLRWQAIKARLPHIVHGLIGEAKAYRELGQTKTAIELLHIAAASFPTAAQPWHDLSRLAERETDWAQAVICWRAFLDRDPHAAWAYAALASCLRAQGDLDCAETVLKGAMTALPTDAGLAVEYARLADFRGDWHEALRRWDTVIKLFPDVPTGYAGRAAALGGLGLLQDAYMLLSSAVGRFPNETTVLSRPFLKLCINMNRVEDALAIVDRLLVSGEIDNALLESLFALAMVSGDSTTLRYHWNTILKSGILGKNALHFMCLNFYMKKLDSSVDFVLEWMFYYNDDYFERNVKLFLGLVAEVRFAREVDRAWTQLSRIYDESREKAPFIVRIFFDMCQNREISFEEFSEFLIDVLNNHIEDEFPAAFGPIVSQGRTAYNLSMLTRFILESIQSSNVDSIFSSAYSIYKFLILCDSVNSTILDQAISFFQQHSHFASGNFDLREVDGVLSHILKMYKPEFVQTEVAVHAPQIIKFPRKLTVCFCVSGQLRGFEQGAETLRHFIGDDIKAVTVVHSWERIGRQLPSSTSFRSRTFEGEFLKSYNKCLDIIGWESMRYMYRNLINFVEHTGVARKIDIATTFQADHVVLDDDSNFVGKSNSWKMLYKIQKCHQLAREKFPEADLYFRTRPDRIQTIPISFDWQTIYENSKRYRRVFVDLPRRTNLRYFMGDQIGIGVAVVMDEYAMCHQSIKAAIERTVWSQCRSFNGHEGLAYRTFEGGLSVEAVPKLYDFHQLMNPGILRADAIMPEICKDIQGRTPTDFDLELLAALESDIQR
jgi:tetratricopeptide (TPR) repeat protein